MRPDPAPMTWMIEAHSTFLSRSEAVAFCTLRILPRMGSSAWNSLSRASLGGAEGAVALDDEQLAAVDVLAAAVLRAWPASRRTRGRSCGAGAPCAGASRSGCASRRRPCRGSSWPGPWRAGLRAVSSAVSSLPTTPATMREAADVPRTSLVWPSNCGSASRTVTTAVSSLEDVVGDTSSSAARSTRCSRSWC